MLGPWRVKFVHKRVITQLLPKGERWMKPEVLRGITAELGYIPWPAWSYYGDPDGEIGGFHAVCPICFDFGSVSVRPHKASPSAVWDWNGDMDRPTLYPSVLCKMDEHNPCGMHVWVRDGQIVDAGSQHAG